MVMVLMMRLFLATRENGQSQKDDLGGDGGHDVSHDAWWCFVTEKLQLGQRINILWKNLTDGSTTRRGWATSCGLQMNQVEELFR